MKYSHILKNPHFNNIAAIIRVPFLSQSWRDEHNQVPFWTLLDELNDIKTEPFFNTNRNEFTQCFLSFLVTLTTEDPRLSYTEDDLNWFIETMDGEHALPVISLLFAWFSAPDTLLTPAEVAAATGTHESTWRNRCARGEIPGAFKKGKQWLIPRSILCKERR